MSAMRLSDFVERVAREINLGVESANKDGFTIAFVPEEVELHLSLTEDKNGQVVIFWPERVLYDLELSAPLNRCKFILPLRYGIRK